MIHPVLMYDGTIKRVQYIKIGDFLMGDDSSPRKVLNKNIGYGKLYKIKNEIGYSWVCNDVHVITHYNEISKILLDTPLNELKYSKKWNGYLKNIKLKKSIVEFQENKTEINPYLLGLC